MIGLLGDLQGRPARLFRRPRPAQRAPHRVPVRGTRRAAPRQRHQPRVVDARRHRRLDGGQARGGRRLSGALRRVAARRGQPRRRGGRRRRGRRRRGAARRHQVRAAARRADARAHEQVPQDLLAQAGLQPRAVCAHGAHRADARVHVLGHRAARQPGDDFGRAGNPRRAVHHRLVHGARPPVRFSLF